MASKIKVARRILAFVFYALAVVALVIANAAGRIHAFLKEESEESAADDCVAEEEQMRAANKGRLKASDGLALAAKYGRTVKI